MDFSYSQLRRVLRCPRQFVWLEEQPEPPVTAERAEASAYGQVMDTLVSSMYAEQWWRTPGLTESMVARYAPALAAEALDKNPVARLEASTLVNRAVENAKHLRRLLVEERLLGREVQLQPELVLPVKGHVLHTRPDLIFVNPGDVSVVDVKCTTVLDRLQLDVAHLALKHTQHLKSTRRGFWMVHRAEVTWRTRGDLDKTWAVIETGVEELAHRTQLMAEKASHAAAVPTPGPHCRRCDVREGCDAGFRYMTSKEATLAPTAGTGPQMSSFD